MNFQAINLQPIFKLKTVFENHDHSYKRTHPIKNGEVNPDGVVYIGDGAWGTRTRDVHDVEKTWYLYKAASVRHFILMTIEGTNLSMVMINEDGEIIDDFSVSPKIQGMKQE